VKRKRILLESRKLEAILFDLDGTLISSPLNFSLMREGLEKILAHYGLNPLTFRPMDLLETVEKAQGFLPQALRRFFRQEVETLFQRLELSAAQEAVAMEGARELLSSLLRKEIRMAIVTRNCRSAALTALYRSRMITEDFQPFVFGGELCLFSREDVPYPKPHPAHLFYALVRLQVSPDQSAIVGDHPMDVVAGRRLGLRTIGILRESEARGFQEYPPDLLLSSLKEVLPALLERGWI
jgi:phosphoglycolate phosphatase